MPFAPIELAELSDREEAILREALRGVPEKSIAVTLSLSQHTVHAYIKQLYRRCNVTSRAQLLALMLDRVESRLHSGPTDTAEPANGLTFL